MVDLCKNRFRKSRKDYEDPEDVQKRATAKRDSRPLLFKFNEVRYNTKPITPQKKELTLRLTPWNESHFRLLKQYIQDCINSTDMCILYLQGFTNAVKRPVRMREFLL